MEPICPELYVYLQGSWREFKFNVFRFEKFSRDVVNVPEPERKHDPEVATRNDGYVFSVVGYSFNMINSRYAGNATCFWSTMSEGKIRDRVGRTGYMLVTYFIFIFLQIIVAGKFILGITKFVKKISFMIIMDKIVS